MWFAIKIAGAMTDAVVAGAVVLAAAGISVPSQIGASAAAVAVYVASLALANWRQARRMARRMEGAPDAW